MREIEFVIAKYKEDLSWIDMLGTHKITIYDKSEGGDLPNIGRESHTYLHHIITNYDNLADTTIFLQGHPFDHVVDIHRNCKPKELIKELINNHTYDKTEPFFVEYTFCDYEANELCAKLFGYKPHNLTFTSGAQWIVKKQDILARPLEFYKRIQDVLVTSKGIDSVINPWTLERVWHLIFNPSVPISNSFMA